MRPTITANGASGPRNYAYAGAIAPRLYGEPGTKRESTRHGAGYVYYERSDT